MKVQHEVFVALHVTPVALNQLKKGLISLNSTDKEKPFPIGETGLHRANRICVAPMLDWMDGVKNILANQSCRKFRFLNVAFMLPQQKYA